MSARGCGQCRSAFTHTQTYASPVSAHNMGGCYCQCPLAEPGLKHAVGAELDSMRKVKLRGLKKKRGKMEKINIFFADVFVSVAFFT